MSTRNWTRRRRRRDGRSGSGAARFCWRGVNGQEPKAAADSGDTGQVALLAEFVALREILLNVLFRQANGKTLTAPDMQGLIDRADSDKLKKAQERLAQAAEPEIQPAKT
jgi:hypothetical protein